MGSAMGLKVCAIEKHKIGGECMNCGCIPSKALLQVARFRHAVEKYPVMRLSPVQAPSVGDIFAKIQEDIKFINEKKTVKMFEKVHLELGQGSAEFVDPHTVRVGGKTFTARRIFIAAGTKPTILDVPGIDKVPGLLTNENIFELDAVPDSMIVLGGGAIACEMAQGFRRLGCRVTMVQRSGHILSRGDLQAAEVLETCLAKEGVELLTGETGKEIKVMENGDVQLTTNSGKVMCAKRILAASGRTHDYAGLKLENAGVKWSPKGIEVDRHLRTSQKHIYAVGDCNGQHLFSHAAMHQGMIALMNTMLPWPFRRDFRKYAVPSTIFTEPQVSAVGLSENDLRDSGRRHEVVQVRYEDYGAAIAEEVKEGFVKAFISPTGRIIGAVIVGEGSGEMINEWALAVQKKLRITDIMFLQHSFPTMGFLTKRVSEEWMMGKMKSHALKRLCRLMFRI